MKSLEFKPVEPAAGATVRQLVKVTQGIAIEKAKEIVKAIKDSKIKVQASIQADQVRVSGKNRDDLQAVIALCAAPTSGSRSSSRTTGRMQTALIAAGPSARDRPGRVTRDETPVAAQRRRSRSKVTQIASSGRAGASSATGPARQFMTVIGFPREMAIRR